MADGEGDQRPRTAEVVAVRLGELLEDLLADLRAWPRFSFNLRRRYRMEGSIETGLVLFHAWRDAFDL